MLLCSQENARKQERSSSLWAVSVGLLGQSRTSAFGKKKGRGGVPSSHGAV